MRNLGRKRLFRPVSPNEPQLGGTSGLSAGYINHLVHGNRPVPSNEVIDRLAESLAVKPEHFREYRLRLITERLEATPDLVDRLYQRLTS